MMYLFDTDHFGIYQQKSGQEFGRLKSRLAGLPQDSFFVPVICFHEQILGWTAFLNRSLSQGHVVRAYGRLRAILSDFAEAQIALFDDSAAEVYEDLRSQRIRIGTMDLRIASIAISRNWTVLTRNTVDFARVPGLKFEDWCS